MSVHDRGDEFADQGLPAEHGKGTKPEEENLRYNTRLLHDAVEGELSPEGAAAFEERLANDPQLARLVKDLRGQREALRGMPAVALPAGFRPAASARLERAVLLDERVDADAVVATLGRKPPRSSARWLAAAAVVGAAAGLGFYALRGGDDHPSLAELADGFRVPEPSVDFEPSADAVASVEPGAAPEASAPLAAAEAEPSAVADLPVLASRSDEPGRAGGDGSAAGAMPEGPRLAAARRPEPSASVFWLGSDADAAPAAVASAGEAVMDESALDAEVAIRDSVLPPNGQPSRAVPLATPGAEASERSAKFQMNLLQDVSGGQSSNVPAWALSSNYFQIPRTVASEP